MKCRRNSLNVTCVQKLQSDHSQSYGVWQGTKRDMIASKIDRIKVQIQNCDSNNRINKPKGVMLGFLFYIKPYKYTKRSTLVVGCILIACC